MPDFNAVLILGHFVVSIFNVPLGQPLYQFIPFPNMEVCQQYTQYHAIPQGYQLSMEYKIYKNAECMTREDFEAAMAARQAQQAPAQPEALAEESVPLVPKGWELQ